MSCPAVFIVDGPDAVGKTTLANKLLDGDKGGYVHLEYWPDRVLWRAQYFALYKAAIRLSLGKTTVIDRHWPSELIYSRAFRDGTHMNAESRGWDRVMARLCGVYIICAPDPDSAADRHAASCAEEGRHEMYEPSPTIRDVAQRYYDLWYGNPLTKGVDYVTQIARNGGMCDRADALLYDIDERGSDLRGICSDAFDRVSLLQEGQYQPALDVHQPNFLGHLSRGSILFVGDEINPSKTGRWPFIDFGASSAALSSLLHDINFDESRGLWTNSWARDNHIQALLEASPFLKVVALGNKASERLAALDVDHACIMHPSYAKRFQKMAALCQQLRHVTQP